MSNKQTPIDLWSMLPKCRYLVLDRLGATFEREHHFTINVKPDFDFVQYAGLDDTHYPIWQTLELRDHFTFIHDAELLDWGYYVEGYISDDQYPKTTDGSFAGRLKLVLQHVDRFGCSLTLRGHLYGTSAEMNIDVRLKFRIRGHVVEEWLGYVGEALSEGYAFNFEGRRKQEFFQYFSALDSFIGIHVDAVNVAAPTSIEITQRLSEKLSAVVKSRLAPANKTLSDLRFWGSFLSKFKEVTKLRDAVAHNSSKSKIDEPDADKCFAVAAIAIALLEGDCFSEREIMDYYKLNRK